MSAEAKDGNVIKGPWKKRPVNIPSTDEIEKIEDDIAFIEELGEGVLMQMIYTMRENGIDISKTDFMRDVGFISESIKSALYRQFNMGHPISKFVEKISEVKTEKDELTGEEQVITHFSVSKLDELVEIMENTEEE